jgi:hypothetical protein
MTTTIAAAKEEARERLQDMVTSLEEALAAARAHPEEFDLSEVQSFEEHLADYRARLAIFTP